MPYEVSDEDMRFFRLSVICIIYDLYKVDSLSWLRYKLLDIYYKYI